MHDIVQKTISLKIQHFISDSKVIVDITKFRHLKYLELHKISLESVKGIQSIRGQVECVVCSGGCGVKNLYALLSTSIILQIRLANNIFIYSMNHVILF